MDTMKAFWRYDWTLNRARLITIVAIAALWPWTIALAMKGRQMHAPWVVFVKVFSGLSILAIPGILLGYLSDLGRTGAPFDFRHINRSLPIDHGRWAFAKIVSVLGWGVVAPTFLSIVMGVSVAAAFGRASGFAAPESVSVILGWLVFLSFVSASVLWLLLSAAVMPRKHSGGAGVFLGGALFVCGELLVRGVTGIREFEQSMNRTRDPWESASEAGLCLVLTVVLALVFVRYHKNRRLWQAAGLALVALAVADGARAWLWR